MSIAVGTAVVTFVAFEPLMALVHRFLFHGPLWCWHKSHHEHPTARRLVFNDLLWIPPLLASAALAALGLNLSTGVGPEVAEVMVALGVGTAAYVAAYVFAHDGVAHGRFPVPAVLRRMTIFRVVAQTHNLHHRGGRNGAAASPFGVYAAHLEYRWGLSARYTAPKKICSGAEPGSARA